MGGEVKMKREVKKELLTEILTGFYDLRKDVQDRLSKMNLDPDNVVKILRYWEWSGSRNRYYACLGDQLSKLFGEVVDESDDYEMFQMSMKYLNNARELI